MKKPMRPRIRRVSKVKRALDKQDKALLAEWWKDRNNFLCCVPGCGKRATERHHTRGRTRKLQNLTRWWAPACSPHHKKVKDDPKWAQSVIVFEGTPREMPLLAGPGQWMVSEVM